MRLIDQRIRALCAAFDELAGETATFLRAAIETLRQCDRLTAKNFVGGSESVHAAEGKFRNAIFQFFSRERPFAVDLRLALAVDRSAVGLRRIADRAEAISRAVAGSGGAEWDWTLPEEMDHFASKALALTEHAASAFSQPDASPLIHEKAALDQLGVLAALEIEDRLARDPGFHRHALTLATVHPALESIGTAAIEIGREAHYAHEADDWPRGGQMVTGIG